MKLQNVQAYPIENVPDHLVYECQEFAENLLKIMEPFLDKKEPNIQLGAMAFIHAIMIKELVSDKIEQQQKAAKMAAIAIIKNVDVLNGITEEK